MKRLMAANVIAYFIAWLFLLLSACKLYASDTTCVVWILLVVAITIFQAWLADRAEKLRAVERALAGENNVRIYEDEDGY